MDPVRSLGQALDAVQVGYVVVVRLSQFRSKVLISLPPDDQGGRLDRAKRLFGALGRGSYAGPVVVDHPGRCPWLLPCLDVAVDLLRRVGRMRVVQEVPEEMPAVG